MKITSVIWRTLSKNKIFNYCCLKYDWRKLRKNADKISDSEFAVKMYKDRTGKHLDLLNPKTFDEKVWYLKLNYKNPLLTVCADKYRVREYVKQCGLEKLLIDLYGVWSNAKDIDFAQLPSPCFIKCNHTSGTNVIYDRNKPFDKKDFIRRFNFMLKQNYYWSSREWCYKDIETRIIAERVMRDKEGRLPLDYKFMCFDGKPKVMYISKNTCKEDGSHGGSAQCLNYGSVVK